MPLAKPFRALRYDVRRVGPLDALVAPPYDVITPPVRERLLAASPFNVVRLVRPHDPAAAAATLDTWRAGGILVREEAPAVWLLAEEFAGPDGVRRTRRGLVVRIKLEPYTAGVVLPHERTFPGPKEARLRLLRATRTKLSPLLLLHDGSTPGAAPERDPDFEAALDGSRSRLWRLREENEVDAALASLAAPFVIADGHHRYETALRFHEEDGTPETGYVLATLVSREDSGLVVFPTHRIASGPIPELNGRFRTERLRVKPPEALGLLRELPLDRPAFVVVRRDGLELAEADPVGTGPLAVLDTTAVDSLGLADVAFTASAVEAETAVAEGRADAAFLVRAPTVDQVEAVARAGETMPQKSTYFFPKLTSGLLLSPFDE
jgi:uncharacterized protein (DUF1015 family)